MWPTAGPRYDSIRFNWTIDVPDAKMGYVVRRFSPSQRSAALGYPLPTRALTKEHPVSDPTPELTAVWDRITDIPPFSPVDNVSMRSVTGQNLMMNMVTLEPGAIVPLHSHSNEQAGYVVRGTLVLTIAGETRHLGPGDCYIAPANVIHGATTTAEGCDVLDVFCPPRQDYADAAKKARGGA